MTVFVLFLDLVLSGHGHFVPAAQFFIGVLVARGVVDDGVPSELRLAVDESRTRLGIGVRRERREAGRKFLAGVMADPVLALDAFCSPSAKRFRYFGVPPTGQSDLPYRGSPYVLFRSNFHQDYWR